MASILYVDDNKDIISALPICLERVGFGVIPYQDMEAAYLDINRGDLVYDLGIIDIASGLDNIMVSDLQSYLEQHGKNRISGFDLVDLSKSKYPHVPIISTSGYETGTGFGGDIGSFLKSDIHMKKPYKFDILVENIRRLLKSR